MDKYKSVKIEITTMPPHLNYFCGHTYFSKIMLPVIVWLPHKGSSVGQRKKLRI